MTKSRLGVAFATLYYIYGIILKRCSERSEYSFHTLTVVFCTNSR